MESSFRRSNSARKASPACKTVLGRYLAAGLVAAGLASVECAAAVVSIDITNIGSNNQNISGTNAGIILAGGTAAVKNVDNFPISGSGFAVMNRREVIGGNDNFELRGFAQAENSFALTLQVASGTSNTTPFRFYEEGPSSVGITLPSGIEWTALNSRTSFAYENESVLVPLTTATPWGAGSYLGFRAQPIGSGTNWNYGYFEVTWNPTSFQFQILSGAYQSTVNTSITVPEPAGMVLAGIGALALGAGAIRRRFLAKAWPGLRSAAWEELFR